ncbi:MAG: hypothetical protein ACYSU6_04720 [Planctomycetota bacterium]|jgi:hypothetical protein
MATEDQQNTLEGNPSELPADHELFAGKVHEELSEREVFAGDEDLYKLLQDTATAAKTPPSPAETDTAKPPIIPLSALSKPTPQPQTSTLRPYTTCPPKNLLFQRASPSRTN